MKWTASRRMVGERGLVALAVAVKSCRAFNVPQETALQKGPT